MWRKMWKHLTFKIVFMVLVIILPLNIVAVISIINMNSLVQQNTRDSLQNITDLYMTDMSDDMQEIDRYLFTEFTSDADGINVCAQDGSLAYENSKIWLTSEFQTRLTRESYFSGFFVYLPRTEEYLFASKNGHVAQQQLMQEYLTSHVPTKTIDRKWKLLEIDETQYAIRMTTMNGIYYGAYIDLDEMRQRAENNVNYEKCEIVLADQPLKEEKSTQVSAATKCSQADFYLSIRADNVSLLYSTEFLQKLVFVVALLCLLCAPAMVWFLRRTVIIPLKILGNAQNELKVGNQHYRIQENASTVEFENSYQSFNEMADNIYELQNENMQKELEKQNLELTNLQLQIRPHFLLNTFNLMYTLASKGEMKNIQELILYLSNYFRYLFKSGRNLELFGKELRLIEGYMDSVKLRYPNRVDIVYQIDPEIYMVRVPPLLIHNFIENAVNHAMKDDEVMHIMLCAEYNDRMVTFQISDNGVGMEEDVVAKMNSSQWVHENSTHVGIANSIRRLQYSYGEMAQFQVESELGEGTVFTISFPYNLEEEE